MPLFADGCRAVFPALDKPSTLALITTSAAKLVVSRWSNGPRLCASEPKPLPHCCIDEIADHRFQTLSLQTGNFSVMFRPDSRPLRSVDIGLHKHRSQPIVVPLFEYNIHSWVFSYPVKISIESVGVFRKRAWYHFPKNEAYTKLTAWLHKNYVEQGLVFFRELSHKSNAIIKKWIFFTKSRVCLAQSTNHTPAQQIMPHDM